MKTKKTIIMAVVSLAAALLVLLGLFRVVQVYRHYRENMLSYESRHLNSITSSGARGLGWLLEGYEIEAEQLTQRWEFTQAEAEYLADRDPVVIRRLMARPDALRPYAVGLGAVFDVDGSFLAATGAGYPLPEEGASAPPSVTVRTDMAGTAWFIFSTVTDAGLRYERAVPVQVVFSFQSEATRVGQHGCLFLLDEAGRFVSYEVGSESATVSVAAALERFPALTEATVREIASRENARPDSYTVVRYPWSYDGARAGGSETLVVTSPVPYGSGLFLGAAESFDEFDSFLSDMLADVAGVLLMELGGMLLFLFLGGQILIANRRNRLELEAVRERADLMEEINRQQQSLAHTERLQQLGVMTSGIVHEFNNLLTPIMGHSVLLLEQLADQEESPQFESALDIYEASENAREVLRRISVMGKRDVDMGFRELEVGELLKKTANLASMARDPHITQELILPPAPVWISANEQLITQAILNLCINACQAMGETGTLTMAAESEERTGRRYVSIRVMDTGPGIEEEKIGSIYDPFFTTKGEGGTGLGLAICQKIIETHKGTIQAANREGGGAMFTVRLPVCDPPEDLA